MKAPVPSKMRVTFPVRDPEAWWNGWTMADVATWIEECADANVAVVWDRATKCVRLVPRWNYVIPWVASHKAQLDHYGVLPSYFEELERQERARQPARVEPLGSHDAFVAALTRRSA